jgi:benzoyl-CoA reductase/2-hydroxyglutaryl-CoA dehydratase subunit BcrC/BadD/HgdB
VSELGTVGITALVPPELVYGCGHTPFDLNNAVPTSECVPRGKLCAWTATWRDMLLRGDLRVDRLVVVAGGDCHNALVDGQKVAARGVPAHYLFYPFDGDEDEMAKQLASLEAFLGGVIDQEAFARVGEAKELAIELDMARCRRRILGSRVFDHMIQLCDLGGDVDRFIASARKVLEDRPTEVPETRIALVGVPPIYPDFHQVCEGYGMQVVFDELPWEFARMGGRTMETLARAYAGYTFARDLEHRFDRLEEELTRRRVEGVVHYTQYACHHVLEDDMLRQRLDLPMLTVQGDLARGCPEQEKLRLEAFAELLRGGGR